MMPLPGQPSGNHEFLSLLQDVWREVSRHSEINESVESLHQLIGRHFPIRWTMVRRWDATNSRLDTVALSGDLDVLHDVEGRTLLAPDALPEVTDWAAEGRVTWLTPGRRVPERSVVPAGIDQDLAVGPLREDGQLVGVVVFGGATRRNLTVLDQLLEPVCTALSNDGRTAELARLKEAAEADRSALLARLQRQDITDTIVGAETGLRSVMTRVGQVARTDAPVLILGETGSGKEVVARAVHTRSSRADGPFLRVNCGAIPSELIDSELFGHDRGAFTGAVARRAGWFERADGGTLFLDEVGDLPPAAQVRLLRVLQDGTFDRVGGTEPITVDVRIVTATHRDLPGYVRDGKFREDLWYRIGVFPIVLPPLRDRAQDIPMLARHFADHAGRRLFGVPLVPSDEDLQQLLAYPWPGNVRELAAVIERAAILGDGDGLHVQASLGVLPGTAQRNTAAAGAAGAIDREGVEDALRRSHGRIEGPFGAAKILGVNPHTLRSRMRRMGIEWPRFRSS